MPPGDALGLPSTSTPITSSANDQFRLLPRTKDEYITNTAVVGSGADGVTQPRPPSEGGVSAGPRLEGDEQVEVDQQILEALKSGKDRLYVLKLGEQMEALIQECNERTRLDLNPETSYQRLLVHRCAAYYKLAPENEPNTRGIMVLVTVESRIPPKRLSDLVPAEEITHPKFIQIMRRSGQGGKRTKASHSHPGSVVGEDPELSDGGAPSEAGSLGGRSTASKKHMTIEEREAAYQEARSRIFMNFEEKENTKERDTSASSSTFSLVSGSGSNSGNGSVGDVDETESTAPTESEWSSSRESRDGRRGSAAGHATTPGGPSRASRTPHSYVNRGSGAASPSFTYPTLYDPNQTHPVSYDPQMMPPPPAGYVPYPVYPYTPPNQPPGQMYHYYPSYPPYPPQQPQQTQTGSDPASPSDMYAARQHPQPGPAYMNPYGWPGVVPAPYGPPAQATMQHPQHQQPPQVDVQHQQMGQPSQGPTHTMQMVPSVQYSQPYGAYYHGPPYAPYPMQPYYPPPPQMQPQPQQHLQQHPQQHPQAQQHPQQQHQGMMMQPPSMYPVEMSPPQQPMVINGSTGMTNNGHVRTRSNSRNGALGPPSNVGPNNSNLGVPPSAGANRRGPQPNRSAWSYGPGISMGGVMYGNGNETVGPRFNNNARKTPSSGSTGSVGAGNAGGGPQTPAESAETSSTTSNTSSSASSSSSRRTFLTSPSKHPLPAKPDWAAGLMPNPPSHLSNRRHRGSSDSSRNMSPVPHPGSLPAIPNMSPVSNPNMHPQRQQPQQLPPIMFQAQDFPPLSNNGSTERRNAPGGGGGGVWDANANASVRAGTYPGVLMNMGHYGNPGQIPPHLMQQQQPQYGIPPQMGVNISPTNTVPRGPTFGSSEVPRFEEFDQEYERPPRKTNVELFNPKGGHGNPSPNNLNPNGRGVVARFGSLENANGSKERIGGGGDALTEKMATLSVQLGGGIGGGIGGDLTNGVRTTSPMAMTSELSSGGGIASATMS